MAWHLWGVAWPQANLHFVILQATFDVEGMGEGVGHGVPNPKYGY